RIVLPELHASIENKLSEYVQRPVTIGKIRLEPTKGLRLSNVLVKESPTGPTLVQIDDIEGTVLIAPFFRDKTIVIPNITIRRPIAGVIQYPDGTFNFTDILRRKKKTKTASSPQVFITHIKVVKGSIDFLRKTADGDFSENFRDIGIDLSLSMDRQIDFRGKTVLPFENSAVEIRGRYTLGSKNFYTEISASQFNLLKYQRQFFPLTDYQISAGELATCDMRMDHLDGKLKFSGNAYLAGVDIRTKTNRHLTGDIRLLNTTILLDNGALTAKGEIRLPATQITLRPDQTFEGDLQMFLESLTRKNGEWFMSGNLKAQNVHMALADNQSLQTHLTSRGTTLTYKNNQLSLFGEFDFEDLKLAISDGRRFRGQVFAKNFSLNYADGAWHARTALRSEKSRLTLGKVALVNSTITSEQLSLNSDSRDLNLSGKLQFIDAVFTFGKSVKFEGSPLLNLSYRRPKSDPGNSIFAGDFDFQNGLLFGIPRVQTLSNLEGLLRISKAGAITDQIRFNVENTNVDISGSLNDWADLNLDVKASTPSVELSRVTTLFPELFKKYAVNLEGRASMQLDFQGTAKAWKSGDIQLAAGLIDTRLSGAKLPEDFSEINGHIR
ncbi:MAG: AsmA family protein, partial [Candidatus Omnitrophica bacterium]|nr:AsmA family protein [Candidatus Omnitrophota bacterium]